MKRITTWSPDTCGCILEYEWDDSQKNDDRVHTYSKASKLCSEHQKLGFEEKAAYDQVLAENTRKNIALDDIRKTAGVADAQAGEFPNKCVWFFDADRNLQVQLVGITITTLQKSQAQVVLDGKFGVGKVKVL